MELVTIVIALALIEYAIFGMLVGWARGKYGVDAPAISGNPIFVRYYRVQQNTMEQLILFIPAMLAFSAYLSTRWALVPGIVFLVGRQLYSWEYVSKPPSRTPGMALTLLANTVLLAGALAGVGMKIF